MSINNSNMAAADNGGAGISTGSQLSLEQKLELLEPRFTAPLQQPPTSTGSVAAATTPPTGKSLPGGGISGTSVASNGGIGYSNDSNLGGLLNASTTTSNSHHSFSFGTPQGSNSRSSSNLPTSAVRSKRRASLLSTATSTKTVNMGVEWHLRKMAATSPMQNSSFSNHSHSNFNRSRSPTHTTTASNSSSTSNHTLVTSHVNHHQHRNNNNHPPSRQVEETPPKIVSPAIGGGSSGKLVKQPKPPAARNLLYHHKETSDTKSSKGSNNHTSSSPKSAAARNSGNASTSSVSFVYGCVLQLESQWSNYRMMVLLFRWKCVLSYGALSAVVPFLSLLLETKIQPQTQTSVD